MASRISPVTESNLSKASEYIAGQFRAHSWWPKEQPGEARREFDLMRGNAVSLNVWCERWLDAGQLRKMDTYIRHK